MTYCNAGDHLSTELNPLKLPGTSMQFVRAEISMKHPMKGIPREKKLKNYLCYFGGTFEVKQYLYKTM